MKRNYFIFYVLLVIAQIVITNFFNFSPYVMLSILPVLILCMPSKISTTAGLFIAFATGLLVDLFGEGVVGLNTLSLVPVAFCRRGVLSLVFGKEALNREEDFSMRQMGTAQVFFAIVVLQSIFLAIYIWADGGSARPFVFCAERFGASLAAGALLSLAIADMLTPEDRN